MGRAKIQIVEDEALIAADIEATLIGLNYDVVGIAATADEALTIAKEKKPDLILMDISLEGPMDGIEAAAEVKKSLNIPVVFLTAIADTPVFNRAKKLEPQAYIMKPFSQLELRSAIDLAIYKHSKELKRLGEQGTVKEEKPAIPPADFKNKVKLPITPSPAMQVTIRSLLRETSAFKDLPQDLLEEIASVCYIAHFKNFDVFVHEGRTRSWGFLLEAGRAAVFKRSPGGKELIVELLGPGNLFGVVSVLDSTDYPFSARSQGDSQVLWIPREVVYYLAEYYPNFNHEVISRVLERLRRAHDFSRALAHDRVEVRIASALLTLQERFGEQVPSSNGSSAVALELTRMELSELVGTTPETISRVFATFVEAAAIDISTSGQVKLLDTNYLEKVIKG